MIIELDGHERDARASGGLSVSMIFTIFLIRMDFFC